MTTSVCFPSTTPARLDCHGNKRHFSARTCLAPTVLLIGVACGGGGGGKPAPVNHVPTAVASAAQLVNKQSTVTLDGSGSSDADQDSLTYAWAQTGGPAVILTGATSAKASFIAPRTSGTLTFSLMVNDGKTNSNPATTLVTIQNRLPVSVPGNSIGVSSYAQVTLDGSGSTDPDGDALIWTWTQTSGTTVPLVSTGPGKVTFTAPYSAGDLGFSLVVNDGEANSLPSAVTVAVTLSSNKPPTASAGADQTVKKGQTVALKGTGTDPDQDPLAFHWVQTSGTTVTLSNSASANPIFTAPTVSGDLGFALTVDDGKLSSPPSPVTIHVQNTAPQVTNATLSPALPKRVDVISVSATTLDADLDPVSKTYQWSRNGVAVIGATNFTYPAGNQAKNDLIAVVVTASDGEASSTGTASVVVQDSPATLSSTAPNTVNYGKALTFQVSAIDPDGDATGSFELEYGPAGLTVSDAGLVTWTPSGPLLDRLVDMRWGVRLKADPKAKVGGTITVNDASRSFPLLRTNLGVPLNSNGIEIQDFNSKGTKEILVGTSQALYLLGKSGTGFIQNWVYPFETATGGGISAVASGEVDGDGRRAIFFTSGTTVVKLDGLERREAARFGQDVPAMGGPSASVTWTSMKCADLDGDGSVELVCLGQEGGDTSKGWIFVLDAKTFAVKWKISQANLGSSLAVGNVDNDPALEIVTSGGFVYDGSTHQNEWAYGPGFGFVIDVGDINGDGIGEVVGGVDWTAVRIYSATLKSPLFEIPTSDIDSIKVADLDGQSPAEIIVGDGQWGNVTVYRYDSQTKAMASVTQINSQDHGVSGIAVGDVDGDGKPDLVWGTGLSSSGADVLVVAGLKPAATLTWKGPSPQLDGPFVGGKLARIAPGQSRLMFATPQTASGYAGMRVMAMDPVSGAVSVSGEVDSNWSKASAFDVGAVYGNGLDQILLGTAKLYDNYFAVFDFSTSTKSWFSPKVEVPIAITHTDLNADGVADVVGITGNGIVYAWDVLHQVQIWNSTGLSSGLDVAVADLDGDGNPEIIALAGNRIVAFALSKVTGSYLESASYTTSGSDLLVADTDGDGQPEVFVLSANSAGTSTVTRLDAKLALMSTYAVPKSQSLYLEQSSFPKKNLLLGVGDSSYYGAPANDQLLVLDSKTGETIWASPLLKGTVPRNSLSFCDPVGDGVARIAFATSKGMYLSR